MEGGSIEPDITYAEHVHGGVVKMCSVCWEAYAAGYMTKTEIFQCIYYLDIFRNKRDANARPKRDPDDPYYIRYGEGIYSSFLSQEDYKDWYYLSYLPQYRRRLYKAKASGLGASAPEERVPRGVVMKQQRVADYNNTTEKNKE